MRLILILLLGATLQKVAYAGAQDDWHGCALAMRAIEPYSAKAPEPVSKSNFTLLGREYLIPNSLFGFAEQLRADTVMPDSEKHEFLKSLEMGFSPHKDLNLHLKQRPWMTAFDEKMNGFLSQKPKQRGKHSFEEADEVAVVVHQARDYQDYNAAFLENRIPDVPTLTLVSENFPILSARLLNNSDRLQWSNYGNFNVPQKATKFHVFGTFCQSCISDAIGSITSRPRTAGQITDVFLHGGLSFDLNEKSHLRSASYSLADKPGFNFSDAINFEKAININDVKMTKTVEPSEYGPAYVFTFEKPVGSGVMYRIHVLPQ